MRIKHINLNESADYCARVCMIGPSEAAQLLKFNVNNRKLSPIKVDKLAQEMLADEWFATSCGVGFCTDSILGDGQHTLSAIVKSGKTVPVLVVDGLLPLSREKMDRNRTRSLADNLHRSGEAKDKRNVTVATFLASGGTGKAADCDIKAALNVHRDAIDAITKVFSSNEKGVSQVGVRAALVIAYEKHGERAIQFAKRVLSDLHDRSDDPALRLRKVLTADNSKGNYGGAGQVWSFRKTLYAFNAFVQGKYIARVYDADEVVSA